jgi:hypothetical protein
MISTAQMSSGIEISIFSLQGPTVNWKRIFTVFNKPIARAEGFI